MGSPVSGTMAEIFLQHLEETNIKHLIDTESLSFYTRYVDDIPEGKRPMGRPRRRWEDNIKWIFRNWDEFVGTGWSWVRIGKVGGHL